MSGVCADEAQRSKFLCRSKAQRNFGNRKRATKAKTDNKKTKYRGVAQFGSASALGAEGRRFESCRLDHN